jgi:putative ABC transport system permease protein
MRMAVGAQRTAMLRMVLGEAMSQVMAGVAVGLIIVLAAARLIASTLSGVKAIDRLTFSAAILVMAVTAVAASYLPAPRATRVDPMVSLRSE